jgi:predicted nucleic acid-binding protein
MSSCIIDSGFLYALIDDADAHSLSVRGALNTVFEPIILPSPAITEVAYFVQKRLGQSALATFLTDLEKMNIAIEHPLSADLRRASKIISDYADQKIDFVDALIVAMAERLNVTKILTIDRRHFSVFRPQHCEAFELLPS